jgi:hypothetical protein
MLSQEYVPVIRVHVRNSLDSLRSTGVDLLEWIYEMREETHLSQ